MATSKPLARRFCVIGKTAGRYTSNTGRHYFETLKGAVEHAENLVNHNGVTAFVAEIVQVVEKAAPPVTIRHPRRVDFEQPTLEFDRY